MDSRLKKETNSQAEKTTAVNPMKELRIEKLVISKCLYLHRFHTRRRAEDRSGRGEI
jgi:hypothetical protein